MIRVVFGMKRMKRIKQEPELIDLTEQDDDVFKSAMVQSPDTHQMEESAAQQVNDLIKQQSVIKLRSKKAAKKSEKLRVGTRMDEACESIRQRMRQKKRTTTAQQLERQQAEENEKIRMLADARKLDATRILTLGGSRI